MRTMYARTGRVDVSRIFRHVGVRMNRDDILARAAHLVTCDREQDHGRFADNARVMSALWSAYLDGRMPEPRDVGPMLALMKIARLRSGPNEDSSVDACGYLALGGELDNTE